LESGASTGGIGFGKKQIHETKKALAKEYLPKLLRHVILSKLTSNFKTLKFSSVTFKREKEVQKQLKLIQLTNLIKRKVLLNKASAFSTMRHRVLGLSDTMSGSWQMRN